MLCKHEVVGSIPSGSTIRMTEGGRRRTDELYGRPAGREPCFERLSSYPSDACLSVRRAPKRSALEGREAGEGRSVLCRLTSVFGMAERPTLDMSVLCRPFSVLRFDIVKRKRIRLPEVGRRKSEDGSYPFSVLRPLSSVKQPVVDLEPDRSDPRMRLKQNWSFQRQGESEIGRRTRSVRGAYALSVLCRVSSVVRRARKARVLAMRAIKCLRVSGGCLGAERR